MEKHRKDRGDRSERPAARPEFEVAYYTKELGRDLQRKMLQSKLASLNDSHRIQSAHGEDPAPDAANKPIWDDRAG